MKKPAKRSKPAKKTASPTTTAPTKAKATATKTPPRPAPTQPSYVRIGERFEGGIFAGIARGEPGGRDHYLIVLDEAEKRMPWKDAVAWAEKAGAVLPSRRELALCYANVPELFQAAWYWSGEQYAGNESCAWYQTFDDGYQDDCRKGGELRARAVRRLPIE